VKNSLQKYSTIYVRIPTNVILTSCSLNLLSFALFSLLSVNKSSVGAGKFRDTLKGALQDNNKQENASRKKRAL
jgi:hypothetical protein